MSSIDFTRIRKFAPQHEAIWRELETWNAERPDDEPIVVLEMIRDLHNRIAPAVLLDAVGELIESGTVAKSYRVLDTAMRVLLPEEYLEKEQIPRQVMNNWDEWITVVPEKVRMVLRPVP